MKCIICDKCKEVIADPTQVRIITCSRPVKCPAMQETVKREFNPPKQDVIWDKELCVKCALEIESLINDGAGDDDTGSNSGNAGGSSTDDSSNTGGV